MQHETAILWADSLPWSNRTPPRPPSATTRVSDHTVLVLQGGGALGAYQAGVYEALAEVGFAPDWVTGVSIGAINAALIAGNPPERALGPACASSGNACRPACRSLRRRLRSVAAHVQLPVGVGQRDVRRTRLLPSAHSAAVLRAGGHDRRAVVLRHRAAARDAGGPRRVRPHQREVDALRRRCRERALGQLDLFRQLHARADRQIGPEHVMASGALPPGFAPVTIDDEPYWDGGLVSNSPLWYVLDDARCSKRWSCRSTCSAPAASCPRPSTRCWSAQKDIQYSSKTRFNTNRVKELEAMREALRARARAAPCRRSARHPDVELLSAVAKRAQGVRRAAHQPALRTLVAVEGLRILARHVRSLWDAGRDAVRQTVAHPRVAARVHRAAWLRIVRSGALAPAFRRTPR